MPIPYGKVATLLGLTAVAAVVGLAMVKEPAVSPSGGGRRGGGGGDQAVPVLVGEAKLADVPVHLEGVGSAKALNTVTVRPQIEGKLIAIEFREGQSVKKGDILARIDATTFQAQLDQAIAKKALDNAQLANARRDMERYAGVSSAAVSQKTSDTQKALVAQLEAQIKQDDAAIANVRAIFGYTEIRSPIDGRTGLRLVDEGNLVRSGDTAIVVITQVQPISVLFTLPQQQLAQINRAMARGPVPAQALDFDNKTVLDTGTVQVVDNQVDQTTGTVRLKADFPNANLQLWPGQFANVRVLADTLQQVVVVPTPALQRGPTGPFVFAVQEDSKVAVRPVTVVMQNELTAVVGSGVQAGEKVVTTGFSKLKDGSRVLLGDAPARPERPAGAAPSGDGGKRRRPPDKTSETSGEAAKPIDGTEKKGGERGQRRGGGDGTRGEGWVKGEGRGEGRGQGKDRPAATEGQAASPPASASEAPARAVQ